jgi:type I restriction enzyme S subunit
VSQVNSRVTNNTKVDKLPGGWVTTKIGDVLHIVRGISFPKDAKAFEPQNNYVACLRTANVQYEVEWDDLWFVPKDYVKRDEQYVKPLDILISTANSLELVGKVAQVISMPYQSTLGAFISLIRVPDGLDPKFVYFQLSSFEVQSEIRKRASTTTNISNISTAKLKDVEIKIPPLEAQKNIVAKVEELFTQLDAGKANIERTKANLARYKASVLKAACEGRLVPTEAELARAEERDYETGEELLQRILAERKNKWEEEQLAKGKDPSKMKYQEPEPPDIEDLPELPEGWVWATVDQLTSHEPNSFTDGPFGSKLKTSHYTDSGPRVIRLQNVGEGEFIDEEAHISQGHFETLKKHEVFEGDLVIGALGSSLPRSCIIPSFVGPAIVKADCMRFKPHPEIADVKYLNAVLNSEVLKKFAARIVHGIGRPRLNQTEVKSLPIPLPPLGEQNRIAEELESRLSVVKALETEIEHVLIRAERLRQAILKRAFEGKLVPQDAEDEPASKLLDQIGTQRNLDQGSRW